MSFVTICKTRGIYDHELIINQPNAETINVHSNMELSTIELASYFKAKFSTDSSCCSGFCWVISILLILLVGACIGGIFIKSKTGLLIYYPIIVAVFITLILIVICFYPRIFSRGKAKTKLIEFNEVTTDKKIAEFVHVWIDRCHGSYNYEMECVRELDEKQLLILVAGFVRYFHMCLIRSKIWPIARL